MPYTNFAASLNEVSRPEYNIKYIYFDAFDQAIRAFKNYNIAHSKGSPAESERIEWIAQLQSVGMHLWAKINKVPSLAEKLWPNLWKISNAWPVNDAGAYQAMKEIAVLYEKYGYTKIENAPIDMYSAMVDEM
jgi:hypothetical protein